MARSRPGGRCACGACEARARGVSFEDWMHEHLFQMHDRIRRNAFTLTCVLDDPPWVYSTGLLDTFGHPELTVVGLPVEEGYEVLGDWAELVKGGIHPRAGGAVDDTAGYPAKFIEVHQRHRHPDSRWFCDWHRYHWFLGCTAFPLRMLQLVYPDDFGRFPGDVGYELGARQRLLDR